MWVLFVLGYPHESRWGFQEMIEQWAVTANEDIHVFPKGLFALDNL